MVVGILKVDLYFPQSDSLKGKRRILQSLKGRISHKFNVAVAEVGDTLDLWQRGTLGIAAVANDQRFVNAVLDQVAGVVETSPELEIIKRELRFV